LNAFQVSSTANAVTAVFLSHSDEVKKVFLVPFCPSFIKQLVFQFFIRIIEFRWLLDCFKLRFSNLSILEFLFLLQELQPVLLFDGQRVQLFAVEKLVVISSTNCGPPSFKFALFPLDR
jgi:hypothetical protein